MSNDRRTPFASEIARRCHGSMTFVAAKMPVSRAVNAKSARVRHDQPHSVDAVGHDASPHRQDQYWAQTGEGDQTQHQWRVCQLVHQPQPPGNERPNADIREGVAYPKQTVAGVPERREGAGGKFLGRIVKGHVRQYIPNGPGFRTDRYSVDGLHAPMLHSPRSREALQLPVAAILALNRNMSP